VIRSELVGTLARDDPDLPDQTVERIVSCVFDAVFEWLVKGGRVRLWGFGTFCTWARDGRAGHNPRTGQAVAVTAKRIPYFRPAKAIRDRLTVAGE